LAKSLADINKYLDLQPHGGLPGPEDAYLLKGLVSGRLGELTKSQASILMALRINPDSDLALAQLWAVFRQMGQKEHAYWLSNKIANKLVKSPQALEYKALSCIDTNRYDECEECIKKLETMRRKEASNLLSLKGCRRALPRS